MFFDYLYIVFVCTYICVYIYIYIYIYIYAMMWWKYNGYKYVMVPLAISHTCKRSSKIDK